MAGFVRALSAGYTSAGSLTSHPIPITSDTDQGDSVHVVFRTSAASITISSVTDSRGNTYSVKSGTRAGARIHLLSTPQNGGRLLNGDTITVTPSATTAAQASIGEYTPMPLSSFTDQDDGKTGASSTSGTVGPTAATTQADDFVIAAVAFAGAVTSLAASGYTTRVPGTSGIGHLDKVVSATGTQSAAMTWTTSQAWDAVIRAFKQGLTVVGSLASLAVTGNGGTPKVTLPGSQATGTVTAFAGTPRVVVAGSQASTTVTANAGSAVVASAYQAAVLADSPLAYYRLGEPSGATAEDSSGNNRDGTYLGTPTLAVAGAIYADSDTAFQSASASAAIKSSTDAALRPSDVVHEFWFKSPASGVGIWDDSGSASWRLILHTTAFNPDANVLISGTDYGFNYGSTDPFDGNWHHLVIRATATQVAVFLDGVKVVNDVARTTTTAASTAWWLSRRESAATNYSGYYDEWAIYSSLSDARVAAHYAAGLPAGATVNGSQASVTVTANAGTPAVTVAGSQASSTVTANAGTARVVVAGSLVTSTVTANAGTPAVRTAGSLVTSTVTANAGALRVALPGGQAGVTDTANAATPPTFVVGSLATETVTANPGTALVVAVGSQATSTVTAFTGIAGTGFPGSLSTEVSTANPGTAAVVTVGALASELSTANAGTAVVVLPAQYVLPPEQIYVVPPEDRIAVLPPRPLVTASAEDTYVLPAENRLVEV